MFEKWLFSSVVWMGWKEEPLTCAFALGIAVIAVWVLLWTTVDSMIYAMRRK